MNFALSQAFALAAFFAIGALCGVCAALASFSRRSRRQKLAGFFADFFADFFAVALPGALTFAALRTLCGGNLRVAHIVFAAVGALVAYSLAKKPVAAIRRRLRLAALRSRRLQKLKRFLTK